jgi:hypothetical protein
VPEKIKIFMWLIEQNTILTKDNMVKRRWPGDPGCYFCGYPESSDHLFFSCPMAKVVWGVVAICFQQKDRPRNYEQFWNWIKKALPGGEEVSMLGLAAIWKARNKACFEKKNKLSTLVKSFMWLVRLCIIGQVYIRRIPRR